MKIALPFPRKRAGAPDAPQIDRGRRLNARRIALALAGLVARRVYANTVQSPGGRPSRVNLPSGPTSAWWRFGSTRIVAAISGWMLQ